MTDKTNNGGPAFPSGYNRKTRRGHGEDWVLTDRVQPMHEGLSLRDYFAALAMQGYLTHEQAANSPEDVVAGWAYSMADAMLRAREETNA